MIPQSPKRAALSSRGIERPHNRIPSIRSVARPSDVKTHRCRGGPKMDTAGRCTPIRIALDSRGIGRRKRIESFAVDGRPDSLLTDYSDSFLLSRSNRCLPKIAVLFGEESSSTGGATRRAERVAERTGYFLGSNLLPTIDPRRSAVVARRANTSVLVIRSSPARPPLIAGSSEYARVGEETLKHRCRKIHGGRGTR